MTLLSEPLQFSSDDTASADRVYVGKVSGHHSLSQTGIKIGRAHV